VRSKRFSEEEKQFVRNCVSSDHKERLENGAFIIRDCPVSRCRFCLVDEILLIGSKDKGNESE